MKFLVDIATDQLVSKELNIKQYKEILKVIWPEKPSPTLVLNILFDIFAELTDKPTEYFDELSVLELFMFILQLRIQTFGSTCDLSVTVENSDKKANLSLNLATVVETTKTFLQNNFQKKIKTNNIELILQIPSVTRMLNAPKEDYILFVKQATLLDQKKTIKITNNEEAETLFYNLPSKVSKEFLKKYEEIAKSLNSIDFLSSYPLVKNQHLPFYLAYDCLIWYIKLLFSEPLDTFYDNMFYLSHLGKINLSYLENCSPGEYIYFVKKLEFVLASKASGNDNPATNIEEAS